MAKLKQAPTESERWVMAAVLTLVAEAAKLLEFTTSPNVAFGEFAKKLERLVKTLERD